MALFSPRKKLDSPSSAVSFDEAAPPLAPAQPAQLSAAPLGAGLRLVSVSTPAASVSELPSAPESQEARAEDLRGLPLGTILFRQGLVEQSELEEALSAGMESGERLGEVLIRRSLVSEDDIGRGLAAQQGLTFLNEDEIEIDPQIAALLPPTEAHTLGAVAISVNDGVLLVVSPDPSAHQRGRLEAVLGQRVTEAVVSRAVFEALVQRVEASVDASVEQVPEEPAAPFMPAITHVQATEFETAQIADDANEQSRHEPEEERMEQAWNGDAVGSNEVVQLAASEPTTSAEIWSQPAAVAESGQSEWNGDSSGNGVVELEPVQLAHVPDTTEDSASAEDDDSSWSHGEPADDHSDRDHLAGGEFAEHSGPGAHHEVTVGRIDELLNRIHQGASTYNDLRARIGGLTENLKTTEEALADRERRLGELTETHEADRRRIDELAGQLREREEALSGLGERLEDLTGRLGSAEERLDEREQRLAELDASLAERARHVEELSAQVDRRDHALTTFEEKLATIATQFFADGAS